jgi:hypothetical protein
MVGGGCGVDVVETGGFEPEGGLVDGYQMLVG